jgi:hypothetical protein
MSRLSEWLNFKEDFKKQYENFQSCEKVWKIFGNVQKDSIEKLELK